MNTLLKRRNRSPRRALAVSIILVLMVVTLVGCGTALPAGWSGAAPSGDMIFIGDPKGNIIALNADNGTQRWAQQLTGPSQGGLFSCAGPFRGTSAVYPKPTLFDDLVCATSYNGKVYAFNAESGSERWVYPRGEVLSPIVCGLAPGEDALFFGTTNGWLYSLDADTGSLNWSFLTEGKIWATPAVESNILYAGSLDGWLYTFDTSSGDLIWKYQTQGGIMGTPWISSDAVFVGSLDGKFYAINKTNGEEKWVFSGAENWFWADPYLDMNKGIIIAPNLDGNLYGIDSATGTQAWKLPIDFPIASSPVIVGDELIIGADDGKLHVLEPTTGNLIQSFSIGTSVRGLLSAKGNIVYARTQEHELHAVDITTGAKKWIFPLNK